MTMHNATLIQCPHCGATIAIAEAVQYPVQQSPTWPNLEYKQPALIEEDMGQYGYQTKTLPIPPKDDNEK